MCQISALNVTEVYLTYIQPRKGLIALARVILNSSLLLDGIGIHQKLMGGYRLTYPTKNERAVFHQISKTLSKAIEKAIFEKMSNITKDVNDDRYSLSNPT